jgi:hypothetical protein
MHDVFARQIVPDSLFTETPGFLHALDKGVLVRLLERTGFEILYADYHTRPGLPEICRDDGRENLGVVAKFYEMLRCDNSMLRV